MKRSILTLLILSAVFSNSLAQWKKETGIYGIRANAVVISGNTTFIGTNNGVYSSTNNGASWSSYNTGLVNGFYVISMALSGGNLVIGSYNGVYTSPTTGAAWMLNGSGGLSAGNSVLSLFASGSNLYAGTYSGAFLSVNNGISWTSISTGLPTNTVVNSFTAIGTNLFAGTGSGVYLSTNNGTSWVAVNTGLTTTYVYSLTSNGTTLFAGTTNGLFVSSNNGTSWTTSTNFLPTITNFSVSTLSTIGTSIYLGTYGQGAYVSSNNGTSWAAISGISSPYVYSVVGSGNNLFAGAFGSVFVSLDAGATWAASTSGLNSPYIYSVITSGTTLIASANSGIFTSSDNGSTWAPSNSGFAPVGAYALAISGSNIFAGGVGSGMFLSTNNGSSWTPISTGLPPNTFVNTIAFSGSNVFIATGSGVYLSSNNGASWSAVNTGLPASPYISSLLISGTTIFAGTNTGLYVSSNNGTSWAASTTGLPATPYINSLFATTNALLLSTGSGVYSSTNGGTSWALANSSIYIYSNNVSVSGNYIVANTNYGLQFSKNNAASWSPILNSGLPAGFSTGNINLVNGKLFLGTYGGGIFSSPFKFLNSFTPGSASIGSSVVVRGLGFGTSPSLSFNGTAAAITAASDTILTTTVPQLATGGPVKVISAPDTLIANFRIIPTISSLSSTSNAAGSNIIISGTGFSGTAANNIVRFGGGIGSLTNASPTQLTVTVPLGATSAPVSVTTAQSQGTSAASFVPTFIPATGSVSSFAAKVDNTTVNSNTLNVLLGDIDNDGKLDVLQPYNNAGTTISAFRNTISSPGSVSFAAKLDVAVGTNPLNAALCDLNGDGLLDLVTANSGTSNISVSQNTSTSGSFSANPVISLYPLAAPSAVDIGDIDSDGNPDIVATCSNSTISIFRNTGLSNSNNNTYNNLYYGSFAPYVSIPTTNVPGGLVIRDLNNDGRPEIIVSNGTVASVYYNQTSNGSITAASLTKTDFAATLANGKLVVADLNGDTKPDLIISNGAGNTISVLQNNSTTGAAPTFLPKIDITVAGNVSTIAVADLNGDSKPDIVAGNSTSNNLVVLINAVTTAGATLTTSAFTASGPYPLGTTGVNGLAIGDIDGDTRPDIIADQGAAFSVLLNTQPNQPVVTFTGFSPASGYAGASIILTGTNFGANPIVTFGTFTATVSGTPTSTSITVAVPSGMTPGPVQITITTNGQTVIGPVNFTVQPVPLVLTPNFPSTYSSASTTFTASLSVNDLSQISSGSFYSYGISKDSSTVAAVSTTLSGSTYSANIPTDLTGVVYYFKASNTFSSANIKSAGAAYLKYDTAATASKFSIPYSSFGGSTLNYQIIALPFVSSPTSTVFKSLQPYNNAKWRLATYNSGSYTEPPASIDPGVGYWLIVKDNTSLTTGGTTLPVTESSPFTIQLNQGWNQIGNPYNFKISWADVLNFKGNNTQATGPLHKWVNGSWQSTDQVLNVGEGGFVNSTAATKLTLSVVRNPNLRIASAQPDLGNVAVGNWQLPLTIKSAELNNMTGGIGMSESASLDKIGTEDDPAMLFPEGFGMPQIVFNQRKSNLELTKITVPTQTNYTWSFAGQTNGGGEIGWDARAFENSDQNLVLVDLSTQAKIDMKQLASYRFGANSKNFNIHFGDTKYVNEKLDAELPLLGGLYPNPSTESVTLLTHVPTVMGTATISAVVTDVSGARVAEWQSSRLNAGDYSLGWQHNLPSGIYLVNLMANDGQRKTLKLIVAK